MSDEVVPDETTPASEAQAAERVQSERPQAANARSASQPPFGSPPSPPPPASPPGGVGKEKDKETTKERVRTRLESVIPEILRRAIELGVEKARESPDTLKQFVHDLKVPKEVAHYLFQQIDDTKNGLFRVVANEMRDFLEHTNLAGEIEKVLTTVQFEVNTTIRFTPNDGRDRDRPKSDGGVREGGESESATGNVDEGENMPSSRRSMPKPEIKTAVSFQRAKRDRDGRRRTSRRGA